MLVHFINLSFLIVVIKCSEQYLNETQSDCLETNQVLSCAKYKFLKYVERVTTLNPSYNNNSSYSFTNESLNDFVKIIYIPNNSKSEMMARRNFPSSEYYKMWSFLKERLLSYLSRHAIGFALPKGARIVEENEIYATNSTGRRIHRRRNNRFFMIPILVLAKLFKVNILLGIILFGILILKKILLAAAFIFPAIIVSVKNACKKSAFSQLGTADRLVVHEPYENGWGLWNRQGDYRASNDYLGN